MTLDGRGLKTVKGTPQLLPNEALGRRLSEEWRAQGEDLDPDTFPSRDMADYAIDIVAPDAASLIDKISAYGDTDTLLYRAEPDEPIYKRQQEVWEPITQTFEADHGIALARISGIIHRAQSDEALSRVKAKLATLNPFELAALETMTSLAASLIVALMALKTENEADALVLWNAASLEEEWQADLWGRDGEAEERRAKRQSDFMHPWSFAKAARGEALS